MSSLTISIKVLPHGKDLPLPRYMTKDASGMDLYAAVEGEVVLKSRQRALLPTGIAVAIPSGYEIQIRPRSGLAIKRGIGLLNSPGTIDADYRGEIKIILINLGEEDFVVTRGMRIAQAVLQKVNLIHWYQVDELPDTERNSGGFGHTGHE